MSDVAWWVCRFLCVSVLLLLLCRCADFPRSLEQISFRNHVISQPSMYGVRYVLLQYVVVVVAVQMPACLQHCESVSVYTKALWWRLMAHAFTGILGIRSLPLTLWWHSLCVGVFGGKVVDTKFDANSFMSQTRSNEQQQQQAGSSTRGTLRQCGWFDQKPIKPQHVWYTHTRRDILYTLPYTSI